MERFRLPFWIPTSITWIWNLKKKNNAVKIVTTKFKNNKIYKNAKLYSINTKKNIQFKFLDHNITLLYCEKVWWLQRYSTNLCWRQFSRHRFLLFRYVWVSWVSVSFSFLVLPLTYINFSPFSVVQPFLVTRWKNYVRTVSHIDTYNVIPAGDSLFARFSYLSFNATNREISKGGIFLQ